VSESPLEPRPPKCINRDCQKFAESAPQMEPVADISTGRGNHWRPTGSGIGGVAVRGALREPTGFRDYVERNQARLLRTAWLLTGDWHDAEDIVQ
jgi:hypothetical protein